MFKWFQVLRFNTNNSIQNHSFAVKWLNGRHVWPFQLLGKDGGFRVKNQLCINLLWKKPKEARLFEYIYLYVVSILEVPDQLSLSLSLSLSLYLSIYLSISYTAFWHSTYVLDKKRFYIFVNKCYFLFIPDILIWLEYFYLVWIIC